jgi:hypothetical protein
MSIHGVPLPLKRPPIEIAFMLWNNLYLGLETEGPSEPRAAGSRNRSAAEQPPQPFAERYCLNLHHLLTLYIIKTVYTKDAMKLTDIPETKELEFNAREPEAAIAG